MQNLSLLILILIKIDFNFYREHLIKGGELFKQSPLKIIQTKFLQNNARKRH